MNYYIVVEGPTEEHVYKAWVQFLQPHLKAVDYLADIENNHYYIISGNGYPQYFDIIQAGIEDVASNPHIDYLVIAIDAEELTFEEKYKEIEEYIKNQSFSYRINYKIIVQYFCIETWFLGNRKIVKRPQDKVLSDYLKFFDVRKFDPENLPDYLPESLTKVKFAAKYFKKIVNEHHGLVFKKRNPAAVMEKYFLNQLYSRFRQTGHIKSIGAFFDIFSL